MSSSDLMWELGRSAFAFLVTEWSFQGPERVDGGLAYNRPDLHVHIEVWAHHNETGFSTTVTGVPGPDGSRAPYASLASIYVACGLGPAQDVPETVSTQHTIKKRIAQHATVLRRVMPYLNDATTNAEMLRRSHEGY